MRAKKRIHCPRTWAWLLPLGLIACESLPGPTDFDPRFSGSGQESECDVVQNPNTNPNWSCRNPTTGELAGWNKGAELLGHWNDHCQSIGSNMLSLGMTGNSTWRIYRDQITSPFAEWGHSLSDYSTQQHTHSWEMTAQQREGGFPSHLIHEFIHFELGSAAHDNAFMNLYGICTGEE